MIVSHAIYIGFVMTMVWAICIGWAGWDAYQLRKKWARRKEIPDEIFGCVMGIILGTVGMIAAVKFHLGW
jgi:hypothetical protein